MGRRPRVLSVSQADTQPHAAHSCPQPSWVLSQPLHNPSPGIPNTPLKVPAAQIQPEATPTWNPSPNPSAAVQLQDLTVYPTHRDKVSPDSATNLLCDFGQVT